MSKTSLDNTVDALGHRPDRHHVFTTGLLAEEEDEQLTEIVQSAAARLGTPIALVTLVLERIQFFKAHHGVPEDLAVSRATERNVSFCQFVVRDGEPFEVVDASKDTRVPQALVSRYGIKAYLGVPLRVDDVVVGSLCVIDTAPRPFTDEQRAGLIALAQEVDAHLGALARRRERVPEDLYGDVTRAGVQALDEAYALADRSRGAAQMAGRTLSRYLHLQQYAAGTSDIPGGVVEGAFSAARDGAVDLQEALDELELSMRDVGECVDALKGVSDGSGFATLNEVLRAAQDLARGACHDMGGVWLPMTSLDCELAVSRALAISILSRGMRRVAAAEASARQGLYLTIEQVEDSAAVRVAMPAPTTTSDHIGEIAAELASYATDQPAIQINAQDNSLNVVLRTL